MWLIVGLGNAKERYSLTRHNAGFMVVDRAASRWSRDKFKEVGKSLVLETTYSQQPVLLVKPQTFMNRSGLAVREMMELNAKDAPTLVVIYDDFNLQLGKLRLRETGSAGGHNGMESIIENLGTQEFIRLRLGIADETLGEGAIDFVLGPFPESARAEVEEMIDQGVRAMESLITVGAAKTMSLFN